MGQFGLDFSQNFAIDRQGSLIGFDAGTMEHVLPLIAFDTALQRFEIIAASGANIVQGRAIVGVNGSAGNRHAADVNIAGLVVDEFVRCAACEFGEKDFIPLEQAVMPDEGVSSAIRNADPGLDAVSARVVGAMAVLADVGTHFSDIDGDTLGFEAGKLPEGLTIDGAPGVISGVLSANSGRHEADVVLILAFDTDGAANTQTDERTVYDTVFVLASFGARFE